VVNPLTFPARVVTRLRDIHLARTAGSLAFTTLLAIVPLTAVAVAFVARFPIFERALGAFEAFLTRHFLPPSAAPLVHEHLVGFAAQAARLTGIALPLVVVTAGMAMYTVEREINAIWGIRQGRSLVRRILVYALCMTVGPVLVGTSISLTTWAIAHSFGAVPFGGGLDRRAAALLPFVFSAIGLTLLYRYVPRGGSGPARRWLAASSRPSRSRLRSTCSPCTSSRCRPGAWSTARSRRCRSSWCGSTWRGSSCSPAPA
jgi:membrane protein